MSERSRGAVSEVRKAALAMAGEIEEAADEIERERRLPLRIVESMKRGAIFGMAMPVSWGGPELDFPEQLRVVEILSRADGSVGWCAMTGSIAGFASSWIEEGAARKLFHEVKAACSGSLLFAGKAERVEGGYRVDGRWPFNSGCQHANVFVLTCHVIDGNGNRLIRPEGTPEMRLCYLPSSQVRILDTWKSTGLRGSGSHDVEVDAVFVPEENAACFPDIRSHRSGPLYVHPGPAAYVLPAVALGIARHAIEAFVTIANHREISIAALSGKRVLLRESPHAQVAVAQADGLVRSARSFVYDVASEVWDALTRDSALSKELRATFVIAMTNAHRSCVKAVDLLYKANGGSSVYARCPLDRCFRDIHTVDQHHFTSVAFDEKAGRVILGLEQVDELF
jgi:alkylation response protein AidB-like acyl-CoA dehydrogenase